MMKRFLPLALMAFALALLPPAFAQQAGASASKGVIAGLFSSPKEDELIDPELAFKLKVTVSGANILTAELTPAKGYYLYKDKVRFATSNSSGATISSVKLPAGEIKTDKIFGKTEVYRGPVLTQIVLNRSPKNKAIALVASYQGCHEKMGVCYPPIEKEVNLVVP